MSRPVLAKSIGNAASTTLSVAMANSDANCTITSDTNFNADSGEGMVLIDESQATEEIAYSTGKTGAVLATPLANRGLEGGSAQGHAINATVKGILTAGMWNDLVDSMCNILDKTSGAVDTTKIVTLTGTQALTNKTITAPTITSPTITSPVMSAAQFTTQAYFDAEVDDGNSSTADTIDWTTGNKHKSTVTGNCTYTFTPPSGPANLILKLVNPGSKTPVWPVTVLWSGGTEPSWTASGTDIVAFYWDGTNYYGAASLDFS